MIVETHNDENAYGKILKHYSVPQSTFRNVIVKFRQIKTVINRTGRRRTAKMYAQLLRTIIINIKKISHISSRKDSVVDFVDSGGILFSVRLHINTNI